MSCSFTFYSFHIYIHEAAGAHTTAGAARGMGTYGYLQAQGPSCCVRSPLGRVPWMASLGFGETRSWAKLVQPVLDQGALPLHSSLVPLVVLASSEALCPVKRIIL